MFHFMETKSVYYLVASSFSQKFNLFSTHIISCNQSWNETFLEFPKIDYNCFYSWN